MAEYKKLITDLDELIKKAPDVDMDLEFGAFLKKYENELTKCNHYVEGLVPRLVFIIDFIRFQTNMMLGGDLKSSLQSLLIWAEAMNHKDVPDNLSNKKRIANMAHILEKKARSIRCSYEEQIKKWAQ
jgi:hypothetical protein